MAAALKYLRDDYEVELLDFYLKKLQHGGQMVTKT